MSDRLKIGRAEFVTLIAMMTAMTALSIDAMLPALPEIALELSPEAPNAAQLILTSFLAGMGVGTFFTGPLSDAFGRKPVLYFGCTLYLVAAAAAWQARSLELMLVARFIQGLGMAGPRVVAMAVIRDLFAGRQMAKIVSIIMMVFTLVPAFAPLIGYTIIAFAGWRAIFAAFILFCLLLMLWFSFRLDETLAPEGRRPFSARSIWAAFREMMSIQMVRIVLCVQILVFGVLFASVSSIQPIYDITFGRADSFAYWFAFVALFSASASFINALLVVRLGMRMIIMAILLVQLVFSAAMIGLSFVELPELLSFYLFIAWNMSLFFMVGMSLGNLNALAMEPLGHIAGTAASVLAGIATVGGIALAIPIGLMFDGTLRPLALGVFLLVSIAVILMQPLRKLERINSMTERHH